MGKGTEVFVGPFDPNKIDVDIAVVNLGSLLEQLEYKEIILDPEFQRVSNVWDKVKKSRLIESVLLGLPLPSFYFSEDPNSDNIVVVDGLQRLCAFNDFWLEKAEDKKLRLEGLNFLTHLNGKTVDDLDRNQIRRFKSLKITINTLKKVTPQNVKYVIFQRVNSAGTPLKPQEMRNALYQGQATRLLTEMAKDEYFQLATGGSAKTKRMQDRDYVNRFLAFYLRGNSYSGPLDLFMGDVLEVVNKMTEKEMSDIHSAFANSMKLCYALFGSVAFRRPHPKIPHRFLKLNKSLFEVLSVSLANLSQEKQQTLLSKKDIFCKDLNILMLDPDFVKSISSSTTDEAKVKDRYEKVNTLIEKVL